MQYPQNFSQLISFIKHDLATDKGITSLYIADGEGIFEELLVQPMRRSIKGREVEFLGIRNIILKDEYRGQGSFKNFVDDLQNLGVPLLFHDIINPRLIGFFQKRGYFLHHEIKYQEKIISYYLYC